MTEASTSRAVEHFEVESVPTWRGSDDQLVAVLADGTRRFVMMLEPEDKEDSE